VVRICFLGERISSYVPVTPPPSPMSFDVNKTKLSSILGFAAANFCGPNATSRLPYEVAFNCPLPRRRFSSHAST
jgi:hypothetical protein